MCCPSSGHGLPMVHFIPLVSSNRLVYVVPDDMVLFNNGHIGPPVISQRQSVPFEIQSPDDTLLSSDFWSLC